MTEAAAMIPQAAVPRHVPSTAGSADAGALPDLCARWQALRDRVNADDASDAEAEACSDEAAALEIVILASSVISREGAQGVLRLCARNLREYGAGFVPYLIDEEKMAALLERCAEAIRPES